MTSPLDMPNRPPRPPMVAGYRMTKHAVARMLEMELTLPRIEEIITQYDATWTQDESYGSDRVCFAKGNHGVVTAPSANGEPVVVTVVWRSKRVWEQRKKMGYTR